MSAAAEFPSRASAIGRYGLASVLFGAYALTLSKTSLAPTSMMFVFPLVIVILVHAIWLGIQHRSVDDLARNSTSAALKNTTLLLAIAFVAEIGMPAPSMALNDTVAAVLGVLFCLFILLLVIAFVVVIIKVFLEAVGLFSRSLSVGDDKKPRELASMGLVMTVLIGMSLEGVPGGFQFQRDGHAVATQVIQAPAEDVWDALETATTPAFPLPLFIKMMPRPVDVPVDEGVGLGANRVVHFIGREGAGDLRLRVVERTENMARFQVLEDTSPFAAWLTFEGLTYTVHEEGDETRLEVSLTYKRNLSPAWVFTPMMQWAGALAMDTLARDVRTRAEPHPIDDPAVPAST